MKKTFLFIAMMALIVVSTNAQISVGMKAGLNVSTISNIASNSAVNTTNTSKLKLGGQIGGYVNIHFGSILGFQPEVLYSMKGYSYESSGTNYSSKSNVTLNYIEIPLQLRVNPVKSFYLLAGPYFGILTGRSSTTTTTVANITSTSKGSGTNGLQSLDFGAALGLGLKAENGFTLGGKYSRGFTSIFSNDSNEANVNSVFQIFVGFEFGG